MKFDRLRSIGHSVSHSLASGNGLLIGVYDMDVFDEACQSPGGHLDIDFLSPTVVSGAPSTSLAHALVLYRDALPGLCEKEGGSVSDFRELTTRYSIDRTGPRFVVSVADQRGHRAVDEYVGHEGRRPRELDHLGRVRRRRGSRVS